MWLLLVALAALLARPGLAGAGTIADALGDALRPLEPYAHTGVLYDRVIPLAHLERLDGSAAAPIVDLATWRQGYDELRRASLVPTADPDLATLDAGARAALRSGVVPLALFDRAFERLRPGALADGSLRVAGGRLEPVAGAPLVAARALAAVALAPRTFRGADVTFALDPDRCFADPPPRGLVIDFADGEGPRPVALGERVCVHYRETGRHVLTARLARPGGAVAESRFAFDVAALATPAPNDTLHITATIPYQGQYGTGDAYVDLAPGHTGLVNPIVVVEGFDLDNSMNWDELYQLLNQENLLETLRADGFDIVVLNFTDATDAVQKNGLVVAELVQQVQAMIAPQATLALVGASMGGLCSRYALATLESLALPHRVRTWISFDGPQLGANIPLGLQYWIGFFANLSTEAATFLAILDRPAARQMLLYHLTNPPGTTGEADPLRAAMLADFAAVGDYPALTRRVAFANGSGDGVNQGFAPGDQIIRWEYNSLLVAVLGDVWALPDHASGMIFYGGTRILLTTTLQPVTVSGTQPWDGAPGGSRATMAQLDAVAAPLGDIIALHPSHDFIPAVSSLALATGDPFFAVAGVPDPLALTPFNAIYYPAVNEEHVFITPTSALQVKNEIEAGVTAAPAPAVATRALALAASPNPFARAARLSFTLAAPAPVDLRLFDVNGREVTTLLRETRGAGPQAVTWDGRDAGGAATPAGVYFARLQAGGATRVTRIVKLER